MKTFSRHRYEKARQNQSSKARLTLIIKNQRLTRTKGAKQGHPEIGLPDSPNKSAGCPVKFEFLIYQNNFLL